MVSALLARCTIVTIGTLYPAYRSYKALCKSDLREVVNCLRYWAVFAIFSACETITDVILSWFPFYYWIKIGVLLWIVSPVGSNILYKRFLQPVLKEREREIDQLIEKTKQKSYSAIIDLTNQGFRYASNVFLNTAVLGQNYFGEQLKRSFSANDVSIKSSRNTRKTPSTLHEESEEENDPEFTRRLKEDQKYLAKGTTHRRPLSNQQEKPEDSIDNQFDDYEASKTVPRKTRNATNGAMNKRSTKSTKKSSISEQDDDAEIENMLR